MKNFTIALLGVFFLSLAGCPEPPPPPPQPGDYRTGSGAAEGQSASAEPWRQYYDGAPPGATFAEPTIMVPRQRRPDPPAPIYQPGVTDVW